MEDRALVYMALGAMLVVAARYIVPIVARRMTEFARRHAGTLSGAALALFLVVFFPQVAAGVAGIAVMIYGIYFMVTAPVRAQRRQRRHPRRQRRQRA